MSIKTVEQIENESAAIQVEINAQEKSLKYQIRSIFTCCRDKICKQNY